MSPRQFQLVSPRHTEYGGSARRGRRKIRRPIAVKSPMHVVFRSTRARGVWSFLHQRNRANVNALVYDTADRFDVRLHGYENVGNHIHLLIQVQNRRDLQAFLRVLGQRIMFIVTGARKGAPKGKFFDTIAYSRVVRWGRDFKTVKNYLFKNLLESLGMDRSQARNWITLAPEG